MQLTKVISAALEGSCHVEDRGVSDYVVKFGFLDDSRPGKPGYQVTRIPGYQVTRLPGY